MGVSEEIEAVLSGEEVVSLSRGEERVTLVMRAPSIRDRQVARMVYEEAVQNAALPGSLR